MIAQLSCVAAAVESSLFLSFACSSKFCSASVVSHDWSGKRSLVGSLAPMEPEMFLCCCFPYKQGEKT